MLSALMIFVACCVTGSVAFSAQRLDRRALAIAFAGAFLAMLAFAVVYTHLAYARTPALASMSWGRTLVIQVVQNSSGMVMFALVALVIPVAVRRFGGRGVA
jgi:hypothetical protein